MKIKNIFVQIAVFSMAIFTAHAQEPASSTAEISKIIADFIIADFKIAMKEQEITRKAELLTFANVLAATGAFCYSADRLGVGTHSASKNMKIVVSLLGAVGLTSYGIQNLIGRYQSQSLDKLS